jgi:hypothetical protein
MTKLHENYKFHKLWNVVKAEGIGKNKLTQCALAGIQKNLKISTERENKCGKTSEKDGRFLF